MKNWLELPLDGLPLRGRKTLLRLGKIGLCLCLLGITVISLLPASVGDMEAETGIGDKIGHIVGYGAAMGAGFFAVANVLHRVWVFLALALYSGTMELTQMAMAAGREGSWEDMIANGAGLLVGLAAALALGRIVQKYYEKQALKT